MRINPFVRYHVPKAIQHHVDYVTPGVKLLETRKAKPSGLDKRQMPNPLPPILRPLTVPLDLLLGQLLELCDLAVTPPCIQGMGNDVHICYVADQFAAMYNITKGDKSTPGNELGIFEDLGDVYSQADLDDFFSSMYQYVPAKSIASSL